MALLLYYYAGTMGLVQRDGINRLRHAMRYSREDLTICSALTDAGWHAGCGFKRGGDGREMAKSDLIVVWGGNPASTQVNAMTHITMARKERGAKLVVVDPYRTASAEAADLHLALLPGTDGALACAVIAVSASYGDTVLNLVVAAGYLSSLIGNPRVSGYLERCHPEILSEFRAIVAATSLEETGSGASEEPGFLEVRRH